MSLTEGAADVAARVTKVLVRYASGIDGRDWDLFRTCFTEDCDVDYGTIGHWRGVDEVTSWMSATHDQVGPTLHRISNVTVTSRNGGVVARSYVHAIVTMRDRAAAVHAFGHYVDEFVESAGDWKIARRRFTTVHTELHSAMH
jgi:3-phenylpropionate/cinnamic acid dioxygenase small subunit